MLIKQIFITILGLSFGISTAGGMFALIIGLGIVPRFAGRTHTANKILLYEDCVALGAVLGNLISIIPFAIPVGRPGLLIFGLFAGMFTGGWAMALAEILNTIPIFTRRINLKRGIAIIIMAMALGRSFGGLLYFYYGW